MELATVNITTLSYYAEGRILFTTMLNAVILSDVAPITTVKRFPDTDPRKNFSKDKRSSLFYPQRLDQRKKITTSSLGRDRGQPRLIGTEGGQARSR